MIEELKAEFTREITECIFRTLQKEKFEDWMNSRFKAFMTGGDALKEEFDTESLVVAEALVKRDIQKLFNIV